MLVGRQAVLLLQFFDRVLHIIARDIETESVGAVFDEKLGDEVVDEVLAQLIAFGRGFIGRRSLLDLQVAFVKALEVLRACHDAIADSDNNRLYHLCSGGGRGCSRDQESNQALFHTTTDNRQPTTFIHSRTLEAFPSTGKASAW